MGLLCLCCKSSYVNSITVVDRYEVIVGPCMQLSSANKVILGGSWGFLPVYIHGVTDLWRVEAYIAILLKASERACDILNMGEGGRVGGLISQFLE